MTRFLTSSLARWILTVVLVGVALTQLESDRLAGYLNARMLGLLLATAVVLAFVVGLNAVRWLIVARILALKLAPVAALRWTFVGHFFNQVFPTSIGGDAVRGYMAARETGVYIPVIASIALERCVGMAALITLIACSQPFLLARIEDPSLPLLASVVVALSVVGIGILFALDKLAGRWMHARIRDVAVLLSRDMRRLLSSPPLLAAAVALSLVMHCANLLLTGIVANHMGANVSLTDVLLVVPTVTIVSSLPISVGGWGVREAGFAIGFAALGQPASAAVAASIVIGIASLVSALPGALLWAIARPSEHVSHAMDPP